jgi:hypothetical protein
VTGAVKGKKLIGRFWDLPVFTRIIAFGKAYRHAKRYVIQNQLEANGTIPYQPRKRAALARGCPSATQPPALPSPSPPQSPSGRDAGAKKRVSW